MNFSFSEDQEQFRKVLKSFVKEEVLPTYMEIERKNEFPYDLWKKMGELGLTGLRIPEQYGGTGADCVTVGIAAEEISRGNFTMTAAVSSNALIGEILTRNAPEAMKQKWLPPFASGDKIIGIALTEPGSGSDAAGLKTRAVKKGDSYVLSGEKSGITLATVADAFIIFAKTAPELGAKGVSAFLVEADREGFASSRYEDLGNIPTSRGSLYLDNVEIPAENLIGEENKGFHQVMNGFDLSRILLGLQAIGAGMQTIDETIQHVKTREAFGQPLAANQGVSFPLVEYYTQLDLIRLHCYKTLWLRDQDLPHTEDAAVCKWLGPRTSREAIQECLLLNGHYAYTKEMPIEQRLRDVMGMEIGDGTAQIQKIVVGRKLFGREIRL